MTVKIKTAGIMALAAVFFIVDRAIKWLFANAWQSHEFGLIGDWFKLKLTLNKGIAFGLAFDSGLIIILVGLALVALIHLAWLNWRKRDFYVFFALSLVICGAFSNLLDRLAVGAVVDYLDLKYFTVFNLADAMITVGIALAILRFLKPGDSCYNNLK